MFFTRATLIVFGHRLLCIPRVLSLVVLLWLSVPVQVTDWKNLQNDHKVLPTHHKPYSLDYCLCKYVWLINLPSVNSLSLTYVIFEFVLPLPRRLCVHFVCLFVSRIAQKTTRPIFTKFDEKWHLGHGRIC